MNASGHSAYEKIKILYEDSLKDIHDLTKRLEQVSSQLNASACLVDEIRKPPKSAIQEASETFKTPADQEMTRAGNKAVSSLSGEVGEIARKIAGDAAAVERYRARKKAVVFVSAIALLSGLVFGAGGFWAATSLSSSHVNVAERKLAEANLRLVIESKRVDAKIAELKQKSVDEIAKIRAAADWVATPDGQLAKKFFDLGNGVAAATCDSPVWEIRTVQNVKWCHPKRRDLFGGNDDMHGWKIP